VNGEGRGHAFRSDAVIAELLRQGHEVQITAAEAAYDVLKPAYGDRVTKIQGARFLYKKNKVLLWPSLMLLLSKLYWNTIANYRATHKIRKEFKPELVVTDFEPAASYFSLFSKRTVVSLDNNHEFVRCDAPGWRTPLWTHLGLKLWVPRADTYLITSFCGAKPRHGEIIIPPIVRREVIAQRPTHGTFVRVYQTSESNDALVETLAATGLEYRVYGMGKRDSRGKVSFREFSRERFLEDMRTCSWVIVNGGFTTISEALALKKPVFAIPIEWQDEQQYNARMLRDAGYGNFSQRPTAKELIAFQRQAETYRKNLKGYKTAKPEEIARLIERSATVPGQDRPRAA